LHLIELAYGKRKSRREKGGRPPVHAGRSKEKIPFRRRKMRKGEKKEKKIAFQPTRANFF